MLFISQIIRKKEERGTAIDSKELESYPQNATCGFI